MKIKDAEKLTGIPSANIRFYEKEGLLLPGRNSQNNYREYDEENHTELYKTLCKYILNERNTVATAAQLYVGRSTLFYRLRKIKEITGLAASDMAKPVKNLYLRFSIFIMEKHVEKGDKNYVDT